MSKTSLHVRDEQNLRRDAFIKRVEKQKAEKIAWAKEQEADCVYVENDYISPSNAEAQLGRVMNTLELESKLKLLNPNLYFITNPHNPLMKGCYVQRNNKLDYICAYHAGFMPEHSIVKTKTEMVWDYEATKKPLARADLPKHELTPQGVKWDENAPRPGWKKIKKPAGELKRGWRTVLMKLVLEGLLTVNQVETTFGEPSSQFGKRAWAYRAKGRQEFAIPW